ncbi:hypothetical protein LSTR_LSTR004603 [Laodelphax striatellus]|uniref:HD domain-containing protein n=1 Tax=Laodelphax striatellus TaxID=195883 RepID=A0A482WTI0_LAOST|nr:hypothetical protein LSTR_LSTR004603 [Laodelphax striatellus]
MSCRIHTLAERRRVKANASVDGKMTDSKLLDFVELLGTLKHVERTGWVKMNVAKPETISGHMYRMASMCFLLDDNSNLNRNKRIESCLVHDMAECIVGDITPFCGVPVEEKHRQEVEAMEKLSEMAGPG